MIKNVLLTAESGFGEEDLKLLADTLRTIERKRPKEVFGLLFDDSGSAPIPEIQAFLKRVFPVVEGTPVETFTFKTDR